MSHAIPTFYNGVQFRSRLEARWAAMFDLLGWSWEYEPIDLAGYIPDFILDFPYQPLLVEVKPAVEHMEFTTESKTKIEKSGWDREVLLLGSTPDIAELWENPRYFNPQEDKPAVSWGMGWNAAWIIGCSSNRWSSHVGVCSQIGSFGCRLCGEPGGSDHHLGGGPEISLRLLWREAGNRVQWKSPVVK